MTHAVLGGAAALAMAMGLGAAWLRGRLPAGLTLLERAFAWLLLGIALASATALLLADIGVLYSGALMGALAILAACGLLATRRSSAPGSVQRRSGKRDVALMALVALLLGLALPPFEWVLGGRDPGTYVNAGLQMRSRHATEPRRRYLGRVPPGVLPTLSLWEPDSAPGSRKPPPPANPYERDLWPGIYLRRPDRVLPQGFHLFPALLAAAGSASGDEGLWVVPLLAVLVVLGCSLLAGRLAEGLRPGAAEVGTGAVLVAGLGLVWYARYPNPEMLEAGLLVGGAWLWTLASRSKAGWAASAAGVLVGATLFTRPDAVILLPVLALLALGIALLGRFHPSARRFCGWCLVTGFAAAAHAALFAGPYLEDVSFHSPAGWPTIGAITAAAALAAGAALHRRGAIQNYFSRRREAAGGLLPIAALGAVLAFAAVGQVAGWAPLSWLRLVLGEAGLAAAVVGGAVLLSRLPRERAPEGAWLLLLLAGVTLFLYLPDAHIAPDLPWALRRFLPAVVPVWAILCGIALSGALAIGGPRRTPIRLAAVTGAAVVLVQLASGLVPTLGHRMYAGAGRDVDRLDALLGRGRPLVLFDEHNLTSHLFGTAIGIGRGRDAFPVHILTHRRAVDWVLSQARGRGVLLVTYGSRRPGLDRHRLRPEWMSSMSVSLPMMEQPRDRLPRNARTLSGTLVVWRLVPAKA